MSLFAILALFRNGTSMHTMAMHYNKVITGELDREARGEKFIDPQALVNALTEKRLHLQIEGKTGRMRGDIHDQLKHATLDQLRETSENDNQKGNEMTPDEVLRQLRNEERLGVTEPEALAEALGKKAESVRRMMEETRNHIATMAATPSAPDRPDGQNPDQRKEDDADEQFTQLGRQDVFAPKGGEGEEQTAEDAELQGALAA